MKRTLVPAWAIALACSCGAPPPPEAPAPPAPAATAALLPQKTSSPAVAAGDPPLPDACDRAGAKLALAKRLAGDGFLLRSDRLLDQAEALCPAERTAARALAQQNQGARAATAQGAPRDGDALWAASRASSDPARAHELASLAAAAYKIEGKAVSVWSGVGRLRALALSQHGERVLSRSPEGELVVLDGKTLEPLVFLATAKARDATAGAFSPDGARVGVLDRDGSVTLYDAASGALHKQLSWADERIDAFAFTSDGKSVVTGAEAGFDAMVRRFDVASGDAQAEQRLAGGREVRALAVAPSGGAIAVATWVGAVELLRADTLARASAIKDKLEAVSALAFSPSGDRLASISNATELGIHNVKSGKLVAHATLERPWEDAILGFSADGTRVRTSGGTWGDALVDIDAATGQALASKKLPSSGPVLSPDASVVAVGGRSPGIAVVDAASGNTIAEAWSSAARLEDVALADGGLALAQELRTGAGSRIELFVASARRGDGRFYEVPGYKAKLAFSPRGARLAGSFGGRSVKLFDVATGKTRDLPDFFEWVDAIAFAGADRLQVAGGPFDLQVGTLAAGRDAWRLEQHLAREDSPAFALSGFYLAIASGERVAVFGFDDKQPRLQIPAKQVRALALSSDGRFLFVVSARGTERVRLADGTSALLTGRCHDGPVSVSSDGATALVGCTYRELTLISAAGERRLDGEVDRALLSPDGTRIVTGKDGSLAISTPDGKERARLALAGEGTAVARGPDGGVELFGKEPGLAGRPYCRVGGRAFPLALCEDALYRDDLLVDALGGVTSPRR